MDGSVLYREEAESNPLGLYDVHTAETDLKTVLNSHRHDFCLLIGANNAGSSHGHQQTLPKLTLDFLFTGTSTSIIMSRTVTAVFEIPLWFSPLPLFNNRAIECTRHVRVPWLWWWLYSASRALVCISWQMGFSAPLVLPVMMNHVSVYQTGHTQFSPHLLLSQSPIPLPPVFIFLPLQASLSFPTRPCGERRPAGTSPSLPSNAIIKCTSVRRRDSSVELWAEARTALTNTQTRCAVLIIPPCLDELRQFLSLKVSHKVLTVA